MSDILQLISDFIIIVFGILFFLNKAGVTESVSEFIKHKTVSGDKKKQLESDKELFERKYFKDTSIDDIVFLIREWSCIIYDNENCFLKKSRQEFSNSNGEKIPKEKQMAEIRTKMLICCSAITLELFSLYIQHNLGNLKYKYKHEEAYVIALIISNIKYDYSGNFINPINILSAEILNIHEIIENSELLEKEYAKFFRQD